MADRYFHPELRGESRVQLGPEAAHHVTKVLRMRPGDELLLFDGRGGEARCRIDEAGSKGCILEVLEATEYRERRLRRVELAFSPPKGGRAETLLQMGTELGCSAFHPIHCQRTPPQGRASGKRWERVLQAAAGQSGARWLPQISPPRKLSTFLEETLDPFEGERWLACPGPDPGGTSRPPLELPPALVLVGPEGDFTPEEHERLRARGCAILPLGPQILRVETACTAALTRLLLAPPAWTEDPPTPGSPS